MQQQLHKPLSKHDVTEMLKGCGVALTQQRIEVASVMLAQPQHLSVEQLIDHLRQRGASVSKATVYNTLNLLAQHGLVREVIVDPAKVFFDSNVARHHHFYDVETGELSDFGFDMDVSSMLPMLPTDKELVGVEVVIRVKRPDGV